MKRILFAITLAAGAMMSSCSGFLEEPVLGKQDYDLAFDSEEKCKQELNGCYMSIMWLDGWWQIQKFMSAGDMCTDDMWMGNTSQDAGDYRDLAHYTGNTTNAANDCQNFWQYRYKGIFRCNASIQNLPKAPIDEALKKRMLAEAKFIRAYLYFDLARNFGGVPLIFDVAMPSDIKGIRRATQAETYAQAEKDLKEAIPDLPKSYDGSDVGRVTSGAAEGLLGKVYLYQEKYQDAATQLKKVIDSGMYELLPDFGEVWSVDHNNSKESLFEIQTNSNISYNLGIHLCVLQGSRNDGGWAWGQPTSNLEKAFLDAGDKIRLKWTIIKTGATEVPGDPHWTKDNPYPIEPKDQKSARCTRKVYIPYDKRPAPYDANHNPLNYRILRYADVLLMYAEAENQLGNDAEARKYLNMVRARVDLPAVTSSGKQLRDAIRLERRLELALEDNRLYDLRRWKGDDGQPMITHVMGPNGSFVKYNLETSTDQYEKSNQKENSNKGQSFVAPRDLLFPIPISEITLSGGSIEQNPGYN